MIEREGERERERERERIVGKIDVFRFIEGGSILGPSSIKFPLFHYFKLSFFVFFNLININNIIFRLPT